MGESAAHAEETLRSARRGARKQNDKRKQASKKVPETKVNLKSSFASKSSRNKTKCARVLQEKADISPDRIARLNELGFVWDAVAQVNFIYHHQFRFIAFRFVLVFILLWKCVAGRQTWDESMSQMKMYHAARGHCNVKKRELKVRLFFIIIMSCTVKKPSCRCHSIIWFNHNDYNND